MRMRLQSWFGAFIWLGGGISAFVYPPALWLFVPVAWLLLLTHFFARS